MNLDPASPRQSFMIRSDNMSTDDFGALFTRMFGNLYAGMPRPDRQVAIAGVYGRYDGVSFRNLSFRGDLLTGLPDAEDEITFVFPTAGRIVFSHSSEIIGTPQIGLAVEKTSVKSVSFIDGHSQYGMSIRRSVFARRLSLLLGKPILQPIRFRPMVDLASDTFQGIKAIVGMATGNEFDQLMTASSLMPSRLQEMLVDSVLEVWPHNYSEALKRPQKVIAPRHVKLAVEYLHEHPDALVSGSELAGLSNVSLRALQDGFRRFVGTSIVSYQRQVRLQRAYDVLKQGTSQSISEIALALGFSNVGRFCQYFQSAYGISPAELRRGH
ncbi:AraC family transcriptional regulator [Pseudomonas sp. 148P]|uniref:AraC family transcriptional regulator n=1 Tax=Pseudomonas ulcerans TaxID=3115852 RepID=A0ABU7HKS4_9PSED|nr:MULTISPECIES: AraC family transcriptional regulator [unclassified Pseudomonas]MEE1920962.1 AraC family transcriptional regulator [Pseudomonas sp. 147P]MEE1932137.1 AraC family transcriptional regulator [Pseudomonas sp. 148P]